MKMTALFAACAISGLALGATPTYAQSSSPSVPTPANPKPQNPVSTSGAPTTTGAGRMTTGGTGGAEAPNGATKDTATGGTSGGKSTQ